jgi:excinuclease UvrABC ATPase subunit
LNCLNGSRRLLKRPDRWELSRTGVSGSGKSSIVFDTVATAAQRQMNEHFSMFIRTFLPRGSQPDGGSHSSMGTVTDVPERQRPRPQTGRRN